MSPFTRALRHFWLDANDVTRRLGPGALERLEARVHDGERRHGGEICVCVEARLPTSYLWRHLRDRVPIEQIVHERALTLFGKLRVWDTELNNGVLIYVQYAEHRVEIIDDRGLARHVPDAQWEPAIALMRARFRTGDYEDGIAGAIDAVAAALERHFPRGDAARDNELPDRPLIR